ncbi:calponin homology domain-containing protein DDB_G0272472-like isoform X1 [Zingiber officinale]|uniref:calponin homology domain-containing protein DDB_G0272472-like isoform X1 n=1 Tax=Zingiber officinale TaxID=94328 RepID=UPI001C4B8F28|nr:calponin homology domain-containing protein DDB_G0272472-like isoform X1 [Zingiber officinale]
MEDELSRAEWEIEELKRRRKEDAQANEKVVSIFAAREKRWMAERQSLRRQIQALLGELCGLKSSDAESASNLKTACNEELEEESRRRKELEKKVEAGEQVAEELKERLKKAAQDHADELQKHKSRLVELLSNQCRMESEMKRALGQMEAAKEELEVAVQEKEAAEAKLSEECAQIRKDCEQKDKVLGAVLRKSKLDAAEKQALLKEAKLLRAKKRQVEEEMERRRKMWESKHKRGNPKDLLLEYLQVEGKRDRCSSASISSDLPLSDGNYEPGLDGLQELQDWVRTRNEKHATSILEQRQHAEIEAFIEQIRQREEKLESFQRQVLGREVEMKMLRSHIEGLDASLSHLREENIKLETLLLEKEKEMELLKEQLSFLFQHYQKSDASFSLNLDACPQKALCSEVELKERKSREKHKDSQSNSTGKFSKIKVENTRSRQLRSNEENKHRASKDIDVSTINSTTPETNHFQQHDKHCRDDISAEPERAESSLREDGETSVASHSPIEEIKEVKEVSMNPINSNKRNDLQEDAEISDKFTSPEPSFARDESYWKTDIHAFGVSYNIKRLKQQLLVLEKLAGLLAKKQFTNLDTVNNDSVGANDIKIDENKQNMKGFFLMKSLLQKQVKRYQSLEEKTDELCKRLEDNYRLGSRRDTQGVRTKEQSETLMCYLEEAFELQKYIVATGQRFMEMQSKINSTFSGADAHNKSIGFNLRQFADIIRTIFRQVQKGLEVRIARIIGDLEGKLTCDSILYQ